MYDVANMKNTHSDGRMDDYDQVKSEKGLHELTRASQEYAFDHTVRHIAKGASVKYVIRCYSYTSAHDTVERPNNISEHFTTA